MLDEIQFKTKKTLEEIASDIGYSRPHLNNAKISGKSANKIESALRRYYAEILQNVPNGGKKETPTASEESWLKRLDILIENNRTLTTTNEKLVTAHIKLMEALSLGGSGEAFSISKETGGVVRSNPVEYLDKKEKSSVPSKDSKRGTGVLKNK